MTEEKSKGFAEWCLVEVMGHIRLAGYVTEQEIAGQGFLRVEIPDVLDDGKVVKGSTQFIGPKSIHTLKPVSEDVARSLALAFKVQPVNAWELPRASHVQQTIPMNDEEDDGFDEPGF